MKLKKVMELVDVTEPSLGVSMNELIEEDQGDVAELEDVLSLEILFCTAATCCGEPARAVRWEDGLPAELMNSVVLDDVSSSL